MTAFFHKYYMQLNELHSFRLGDAIHFHNELNQAIFDGDTMNPLVRQQLLDIAEDFMEHLGVSNIDVQDVTLSGSNAAYTYTRHSDIDLHILVDMGTFKDNDVYRELFDAKKTIYNDKHNIKIHNYDVELYVQDSNQPVISLGEYSVLNDKWIRLPRKRKSELDQAAAKLKFEKIYKSADYALKSNNIEKIEEVIKTIKKYRQAGLDLNGEFGPENLAFKALRTKGIIKKLYARLQKLHSDKLSIPESKKIERINKDSLEEKLSQDFKKFKTKEDYDPNGKPPGPEFKPTMPAGTVKVDVSDVYDWYKLGQHISNLKGLGHHDFGKGPPSTIMAFGSEPEEHKYIKDLEKTGLTTTDIDPIDKNQPKGMKRQKVDPTYNVNEAFDQPYKLKWEKGEHGDVDALVKLPDGTPLSIMFNHEGMDNWQVEFYRNNSQELTSEGDAQRIFATVLNAIQKFVKKYKPNVIKFSASKQVEPGQSSESRAKLYDRLVQRYANSWGYDANVQNIANEIVLYALTRRNQKSMYEASGYIPSEQEKNDPRWKTALTVDIKPDTMQKNAKKLGSKISRAGLPPLLRA